jgi:hypothetical protein
MVTPIPLHSCSVMVRDLGSPLESSFGRITCRYSHTPSVYLIGAGGGRGAVRRGERGRGGKDTHLSLYSMRDPIMAGGEWGRGFLKVPAGWLAGWLADPAASSGVWSKIAPFQSTRPARYNATILNPM